MESRRPKPGERLFGSLFGVKDQTREQRAIAEIRAGLLNLWRDDYWAWLTGVDPTTNEMMVAGRKLYFPNGRPLVWTTDEKDKANPIKPFPDNKPYLKAVAHELMTNRVVLIDKARQMIITTLCLQLYHWRGLFLPSRRFLVSRTKEEDATELLKDKVRAVHERLPDWLKAALPISNTPQNRVDYGGTGSYVRAVSQNVAFSEARGGSASGMLIDEAAFQDLLGEIVTASLPMTGELWMVTTAYVGNRGSQVFYKYLNEGKEVGQ